MGMFVPILRLEEAWINSLKSLHVVVEVAVCCYQIDEQANREHASAGGCCLHSRICERCRHRQSLRIAPALMNLKWVAGTKASLSFLVVFGSESLCLNSRWEIPLLEQVPLLWSATTQSVKVISSSSCSTSAMLSLTAEESWAGGMDSMEVCCSLCHMVRAHARIVSDHTGWITVIGSHLLHGRFHHKYPWRTRQYEVDVLRGKSLQIWCHFSGRSHRVQSVSSTKVLHGFRCLR